MNMFKSQLSHAAFPENLKQHALKAWHALEVIGADIAIHLTNAELLFVSACGTFFLAVAYSTSRADSAYALALFWLGALFVYVPCALKIILKDVTLRDRVWALCLVTLGVYFIKVLQGPIGFVLPDEFHHWRNVIDTVQSSHLFTLNRILPITPSFPGLPAVMSALVSLTRADIFPLGIILIGAVKLLLSVSLFFIVRGIGHSDRLAGIAVVVYIANPNYVYFQSQFAYESLALPLAMLAIYILERRTGSETKDRPALTILLLLCIGAVILAHHLTSYALVTMLAAWTIGVVINRKRRHGRFVSVALPVVAMLAASAWLVFAADLTLRYLAQPLVGGTREFIQLLQGESIARNLFGSDAGTIAAPVWERAISFLGVGLTLAAMATGLVIAWRCYRGTTGFLVFASLASLYPFMLALRFTKRGWETSNRSSEYLYVGVAFFVAVSIVTLLRHQRSAALALAKHAASLLLLTILFISGINAGWPYWSRLHGPYMVSADTRSISAEGIATATWAKDFLGPDQRVFTDRVNRTLMESYGQQKLVTKAVDGADGAFMFSEKFTNEDLQQIRQANIRYVVVDKRLSNGLPYLGVYFEGGEPYTFSHQTPISEQALTKFGQLTGVNTLYDSGNIVVYDLRRLHDHP